MAWGGKKCLLLDFLQTSHSSFITNFLTLFPEKAQVTPLRSRLLSKVPVSLHWPQAKATLSLQTHSLFHLTKTPPCLFHGLPEQLSHRQHLHQVFQLSLGDQISLQGQPFLAQFEQHFRETERDFQPFPVLLPNILLKLYRRPWIEIQYRVVLSILLHVCRIL